MRSCKTHVFFNFLQSLIYFFGVDRAAHYLFIYRHRKSALPQLAIGRGGFVSLAIGVLDRSTRFLFHYVTTSQPRRTLAQIRVRPSTVSEVDYCTNF